MLNLIWILIQVYVAGVVLFGGWTFILCQALDDNERLLKKPYELVVVWPLSVAGAIILGIDKVLDRINKPKE